MLEIESLDILLHVFASVYSILGMEKIDCLIDLYLPLLMDRFSILKSRTFTEFEYRGAIIVMRTNIDTTEHDERIVDCCLQLSKNECVCIA